MVNTAPSDAVRKSVEKKAVKKPRKPKAPLSALLSTADYHERKRGLDPGQGNMSGEEYLALLENNKKALQKLESQKKSYDYNKRKSSAAKAREDKKHKREEKARNKKMNKRKLLKLAYNVIVAMKDKSADANQFIAQMDINYADYKTTPVKVPRAENGYMIFANEKRQTIVDQNPDVPMVAPKGEVSIGTLLGQMWKALDKTEKDKYKVFAKHRNQPFIEKIRVERIVNKFIDRLKVAKAARAAAKAAAEAAAGGASQEQAADAGAAAAEEELPSSPVGQAAAEAFGKAAAADTFKLTPTGQTLLDAVRQAQTKVASATPRQKSALAKRASIAKGLLTKYLRDNKLQMNADGSIGQQMAMIQEEGFGRPRRSSKKRKASFGRRRKSSGKHKASFGRRRRSSGKRKASFGRRRRSVRRR
jgi:hypothetical protein